MIQRVYTENCLRCIRTLTDQKFPLAESNDIIVSGALVNSPSTNIYVLCTELQFKIVMVQKNSRSSSMSGKKAEKRSAVKEGRSRSGRHVCLYKQMF